MARMSRQFAQMLTDEELLAGTNGEVCMVCSGVKKESHAFCRNDYLALPLGMRLSLDGALQSERADVLRRCVLHLAGIEPRPAVQITTRDGSTFFWPHHSQEDLEGAGYRFSQHTRCEACGAQITFYVTPKKKFLAVNFPDCAPHFTTCKDPGFFQRRKEKREAWKAAKRAQTSAKRKAARERRLARG